MVKAIEWKDGKVIMLDQSRLPVEVKFIECADYHIIAEGIKKLWIRGAPAIGIAAAMGIALGAQDINAKSFKDFMKGIDIICNELLATRPTAVNIKWAVERIKKLLKENRVEPVSKLKELLISEAQRIHEEDIEVNKAIGRWGAQFIKRRRYSSHSLQCRKPCNGRVRHGNSADICSNRTGQEKYR